MATMELLANILGSDLQGLTEREMGIASRVADWFCVSPKEVEDTSSDEQNLIRACRYALEEEGVNWESIMLNRTRKRSVVCYRDAIISIIWKRAIGTQEYKTSLLGGMLTRATVLHAVESASDWIVTDRTFKSLYKRLEASVDEFLALYKI